MGFVTKGLQQRMQKALSFSHLASMGARRMRAQDNDTRDPKDDDGKDDDDDKNDDGGGDTGERNREDQNSRKGETRRAQDDDDSGTDADAAEEGDDGDRDADPDNDSGKGKRARSRAGSGEDEQAQDDDEEEDKDDKDDDEMEMRGRSPAAKARRREQARCAAIFASRAAARNPVMAAHLAFRTRLPRKEAVAMLEATPAPGLSTDRSLRNPRVGPGGSQELSSRQAVASSWDRAFEKVNPRARRA
jgi:hypothetical protein